MRYPAREHQSCMCPLKMNRDGDGNLNPRAREALIEEVKVQVNSGRFRMCVVFGPDDAVFVEKDGVLNPSTTQPSGGFKLEGELRAKK